MSCYVCLFQKSCSALFCVVMSLMLDIKMLDKVLWGCFGGWGGGDENVLDSTLLMVYVQEVSYVLLSCAFFVCTS